jgi:hypothetical protein
MAAKSPQESPSSVSTQAAKTATQSAAPTQSERAGTTMIEDMDRMCH